jgi:hypothetical protein
MGYRLLADGIVVVHLAFVAFVIFGALFAFRWPKFIWLHIPAFLWGAMIEFSGRICPLTPLENVLRRKGGEAGYGTSFIEQYLLPVLYPAALTPNTQIVLGTLLVLFNIALYGLLIRYLRRKQKGGKP